MGEQLFALTKLFSYLVFRYTINFRSFKLPKIEFQLNETKIIEKLPSYALEPIFHFWSAMCKDKISIYPLIIPNSDNSDIEAFCIRHDETLAIVNPYTSDSIHGAVVDVAIDRIIQDRKLESKEIRYKLILSDEVCIESKDFIAMPERRIKEIGSLSMANEEQAARRFIVFSEELMNDIESFALSEPVNIEKLAGIETEMFWDPENQIPWIFAYNLIPFSDVEANDVFVQVRGGENSASFIRAIDKPISLFHTHLVNEDNYRKCFFSETDRSTLRRHLKKNQFSLVGNIVPTRQDMGCLFHLWTFDGYGNIIRESFYICKI